MSEAGEGRMNAENKEKNGRKGKMVRRVKEHIIGEESEGT